MCKIIYFKTSMKLVDCKRFKFEYFRNGKLLRMTDNWINNELLKDYICYYGLSTYNIKYSYDTKLKYKDKNGVFSRETRIYNIPYKLLWEIQYLIYANRYGAEYADAQMVVKLINKKYLIEDTKRLYKIINHMV